MTQDEIMEMAKQAGLFTHKEVQPEIVAFAKLVAEKALAQRTWVGLTEEEIRKCFQIMYDKQENWPVFANAIEAKLKEKNT